MGIELAVVVVANEKGIPGFPIDVMVVVGVVVVVTTGLAGLPTLRGTNGIVAVRGVRLGIIGSVCGVYNPGENNCLPTVTGSIPEGKVLEIGLVYIVVGGNFGLRKGM